MKRGEFERYNNVQQIALVFPKEKSNHNSHLQTTAQEHKADERNTDEWIAAHRWEDSASFVIKGKRAYMRERVNIVSS